MAEPPVESPHRCGLAALVGRPNVGKSTLLNRLVGEKVSIVTRKPHTTRHRILGIHNRPDAQVVYVDTPGLHQGARSMMNRSLNRAAEGALEDVDTVVLVVDAQHWTEQDEAVLERLADVPVPVLLALNKVDRLPHKEQLLPLLESLSGRREFAALVPLSATRGINVDALEAEVVTRLPESPALFETDRPTDRSERFRVAELFREQLMATLGEELPYATAVGVERYEREGRLLRLSLVVWVERDGQKAIVIGAGGRRLKALASAARREMEAVLRARVHMEVWVKVRSGWPDDERALRSLGYGEDA